MTKRNKKKNEPQQVKPITKSVQPAPKKEKKGRARAINIPASYSPEEQVYKQFRVQAFGDTTKYQPFGQLRNGTQIIGHFYPVKDLLKLATTVSIVSTCINVIVTNVMGHGSRLEYIGPEGDEETAEAKAEKKKIKKFLATVNPDYSLEKLLSMMLKDKETIGWGTLEVIRDRKGNISEVHHVPADCVYLTTQDNESTDRVKVYFDGEEYDTKVMSKKFRYYVQRVGNSGIVYKEFGDPRSIHFETGLPGAPDAESANELAYFTHYSPGLVYGLPIWFSAMTAVLGLRESELANLDFFKNNGIPAMAVLVAGGQLNEEAFQAITSHLMANDPAGNRRSLQRVLVLEAVGDPESFSASGALPVPTMKIEPLHDARQNDAMFREYDKEGQAKVRSAFRLNPIVLGRAEEMTYATAEASVLMAEAQVFSPVRKEMEQFVNDTLLAIDGKTNQYWRYRLNPSRVINPESITKVVKSFDTAGAMTPNVAIELANKYLDLQIERIKEAWGDYPMKLGNLLASLGRLEGIDELINEESYLATELGVSAPAETENNVNTAGSTNETNTARENSNKTS